LIRRALLGHPGQLALQPPVLGLVIDARLRRRLPEKLHPLVERILAGPQASGHLPHGISAHRDLMHRVPLELVAVVACPLGRLLGSK
jgi:hypothetical protein